MPSSSGNFVSSGAAVQAIGNNPAGGDELSGGGGGADPEGSNKESGEGKFCEIQ